MKITSSAFGNNEFIPQRFTCDGENLNPKIIIEDIPKESESLALIMEDPDAPAGSWTHWVLWNIPPEIDIIDEGIIPEEATEGVNSSGSQNYQGPCPPTGTHRYVFRIYALRERLELSADSEKDDLIIAMEGLIIETAEIIGLYSRS